MKHIFAILFTWSISMICGTMLMIQMEIVKWTPIKSFVPLQFEIRIPVVKCIAS